jgi:hypothetical protein
MTNPLFSLFLGAVITATLFVVIRLIFARNVPKGFCNFFIGDTGRYSIARLQAVMWAFIIISSQVSFIIAILINKTQGVSLYSYQVTFTEQVLWLLGLSLTGYVSVKGISVNQISQRKRFVQQQSKMSDFITGDNGLDFSKFQMLIWTIIAILIYLASSYEFIRNILIINAETPLLAKKALEDLINPNNNHLPTLDWSMVVLMGLSQGAYIGRKLIPNHKIDEAKNLRCDELEANKEKLNNEISVFEESIKNIKTTTKQGKAQFDDLSQIILEKKLALSKIEQELKSINEITQ